MEKTTTLTVQMDPVTEKKLENIFSRFGLSMSDAVDLFFHQVLLTERVSLPEVPLSVNADLMTKEQVLTEIREGLEDARAKRYQDVSEFQKEFLESRGYDVL